MEPQDPEQLPQTEPAQTLLTRTQRVVRYGAWILADADVLGGRTITSYPSLRTDLVNAGAAWVDEEVVVDQGLVSSRTPDDLPAFNAKVVEEIGEGRHAGQRA